MSSRLAWDELRMQQVLEGAKTCPDACAQDVRSLIDELRTVKAALQQVYDFGHLTTREYAAKYPNDTRHRSEIMRAAGVEA